MAVTAATRISAPTMVPVTISNASSQAGLDEFRLPFAAVGRCLEFSPGEVLVGKDAPAANEII